jgi:ABC-2 type transport system ATP-binding protein
MADVVSLCLRVMLIDKGRLLFDGNLSELAEKIAPFKLLRLAIGGNGHEPKPEDVLVQFKPAVTIIEHQGHRYTLRVKKSEAAQLTAHILRNLTVLDMTVEDPPIEAVIDQVYREGGIS